MTQDYHFGDRYALRLVSKYIRNTIPPQIPIGLNVHRPVWNCKDHEGVQRQYDLEDSWLARVNNRQPTDGTHTLCA